MSEPLLDWDIMIDVDSEDFVLLEEGDYEFTVQQIERALSSQQNRMLKITLNVTDGEHQSQITDYLVITTKALWKISDFLRATALKKHDESVPLTVAEKAIGKTGVCHVIVDEFEGNDGKTKKSNKISRYYPQDGPNAKKPGLPKTSVKPSTENVPW